MKAISIALLQRVPLRAVLIDIIALAFIYSIPALSHMLSLPVYLIEPMRLMLIIAMVHSNKTNAYIIALTMPLFSYLVSGHPQCTKPFLFQPNWC